MSEFKDLIYYKQDIIDTYFSRRKGISKVEIEDLIDCVLLFLESSIKEKSCTSIEIPNVGFLHKKLDFSKIEKMSNIISEEEEIIIQTVYLETRFSPIITRKELMKQYYPEISLQELQNTQNDK